MFISSNSGGSGGSTWTARFSFKSVFVVIVVVIVLFFFTNIVLFSEKLCETQKIKLEEEVAKLTYQLKEDLVSLRQENTELRKKLDDTASDMQQLKVFTLSPSPSPSPSPFPITSSSVRTGQAPTIPIILFTYNRPNYLIKTLTNLFKHLPDEGFPVIVSQDGVNEEVSKVIKQFPKLLHIQRADRPPPQKRSPQESDSYYHISAHYKFGLHHVFDKLQYDAVVIIEDDMDISPDFFSYFAALLPLLQSDPTLLCVSAWNDNGQVDKVKNSSALYRSNFFPGLGWMMTRQLWTELSGKWPLGYWDDWLREPDQRKERDCIRPEVSRTYTFGREGSSAGQFFEKYLEPIKLNEENIDWRKRNLDYLRKDNYDDKFFSTLKKGAVVINSAEETQSHTGSTLVLFYRDENSFRTHADFFGIMTDWKAGVPRTAYNGVVVFYHGSNTIVLTQQSKWKDL